MNRSEVAVTFASRKLPRCENGTVAVEFAFIAPLLILLFLGTIELCNALICRQKVTTVAASAADLVAQDKTVTGAQVNDIFSALNAIMYPYPTGGSKIIITSVKVSSTQSASPVYVVDWSVAQNGTPHAVGSPIVIPAGLLTTGGSVILAEFSYTYTPPSNQIIHLPFVMSDQFYSRPRQSNFVTYTP
jgi:Flp pilus assembly protein TadG